MPTPAEAAVKKLAKLPSNCVCANCGTVSKYGFSTVCIKYLTFVCNSCKSSHQAVSHRCKSLTMSSWDQGEVLKLKTHGNDYARKTWLAMAPQPGVGGRPKEGDDVNVFKRFVVEVYENKRYYRDPEDSDAGDQAVPVSQARAPVAHASIPKTRPVAAPSPKRVPKRAPAPMPAPTPAPVAAPAPAVDLLDFGAFDSVPAPATAHVAAASQVGSSEFGNFADFSQVQSTPVAAPQVASSEIGNFADFSQVQSTPAASDTFDPFNSASTQKSSQIPKLSKPSQIPAPAVNDPFAPSTTQGASGGSTSNDLFAQPSNKSFDPFNSNSNGGTSNGNNQMNQAPMNSTNAMAGGNNGMMNNMGGMTSGSMNNNSNIMMNNGMMSNNTNNMMMNNGMNNNMMMMNNGMMNNNNNMMMMNAGMMNRFTPQQQMMMQNPSSFGMNGMQQNNMNTIASTSGAGGGVMNINVMQPMNNSISSSFASPSTSHVETKKKADPFSGLGF